MGKEESMQKDFEQAPRIFTAGTNDPEAVRLYEKFYTSAEIHPAKVRQALDLVGKMIVGQATNVEPINNDSEVTDITITVKNILEGNNGRGWDRYYKFADEETEKVVVNSPEVRELNESRRAHSGKRTPEAEQQDALRVRVAVLKAAVVLIPITHKEEVQVKTS